MSTTVHIVIPTHHRAGRISTWKVFPSGILCVAASQADAYREHHPDREIVVHPDSVKGLASKRQWIYQHFGDVFMADDDITTMIDLSTPRGQPSRLMPPITEEIVHRTADTARQLGAFLFGFNSHSDPLAYTEFKPVKITGYVAGHATGILSGSKLWWRDDMSLNDDYWISALNMYYHRLAFIDNRYGLAHTDTFHNLGGLSHIRTTADFKASWERLRQAFGSDLVHRKKDRPGLTHDWQTKFHWPL